MKPAAIADLVQDVKRRPFGQALLPEADLWARLGLSGAAAAEQKQALAHLRTALTVTAFPQKDAFYLEWVEPEVKQPARKSPQAMSVHSQKTAATRSKSSGLLTVDLDAPFLRAVSVRQPYVELILRGEKTEEFRSWSTSPGPLLLHASRTVTPDEREVADEEGIDLTGLPLGALVGIVDVVGIEGSPGDYAWQLTEPRRFASPVIYKGAAAIMRVPMSIVRASLLVVGD